MALGGYSTLKFPMTFQCRPILFGKWRSLICWDVFLLEYVCGKQLPLDSCLVFDSMARQRSEKNCSGNPIDAVTHPLQQDKKSDGM